mgnify:CR=1 FL=1
MSIEPIKHIEPIEHIEPTIEPIDFSGTDPFDIPGNLLDHIYEELVPDKYNDGLNITNKDCTFETSAIQHVDVPSGVDATTNMYRNGKESIKDDVIDDDILQIASPVSSPVSTFDRYISEIYNCTPLHDVISAKLHSSGKSSSSSMDNSGESNHDMHINDAQLAYGVQNSYEQTNSSPNNILQHRLHKNPSTKRKQQHNPQELLPRRRRKLLPSQPAHERKNVSLRCNVRKCLSALEDAKNLSTIVKNDAMLNFVTQTMKQTRYDFMQQFGYEIDTYCLPTLRSQCTIYKDTIGETCTVVYRSTSIIKVETQSGAIVEFRQEKNEWWNQNTGQVLSY